MKLIAEKIKNQLIGRSLEHALAIYQGWRLVHVITYKGCFGELLAVDTFKIFNSAELDGESKFHSFSTINEAINEWDKITN